MGLTGIVLCATGITLSEIEKTAHSLGLDPHAISLDLRSKQQIYTTSTSSLRCNNYYKLLTTL